MCSQICKMDLFGDKAEEKKVSGVTHAVSEAKANKTTETFLVIGRFVSVGRVGGVLQSLKEVSHLLCNG
jgi:hypothetical protein